MARDPHIAAYEEAMNALKINQAVTSLATRFDTKLVMRVMREWLDFMDRQAEQSDGQES
jgi:hypothetical protein